VGDGRTDLSPARKLDFPAGKV
jgi:hypothetical protein